MPTTIDYPTRPEMMMTSRQVSKLYFAALELIEAMEMEGCRPVEPVAEALNKLAQAVEEYQGEELTNGNNHNDG